MVFDTEKLRSNVHSVIARRQPLHIHTHIADQENSPTGLTHVQHQTLPLNAPLRKMKFKDNLDGWSCHAELRRDNPFTKRNFLSAISARVSLPALMHCGIIRVAVAKAWRWQHDRTVTTTSTAAILFPVSGERFQVFQEWKRTRVSD